MVTLKLIKGSKQKRKKGQSLEKIINNDNITLNTPKEKNIPAYVLRAFETVIDYAVATYNRSGSEHHEDISEGITILLMNRKPYENEFWTTPRAPPITPSIYSEQNNALDKYLTTLWKKNYSHDGAIIVNSKGEITPSQMINGVIHSTIEEELKALPGNARTSSAIYWSKNNKGSDEYAILLQASTGIVNLLHGGRIVKSVSAEDYLPPISNRMPIPNSDYNHKIIKVDFERAYA